jgi:hypothetical protein
MASESKARSSSDEAILRERERSNEAVLRLLASWCDPGEEQEQRETLEYLKRVLDEDRPSSRKLFHPTGAACPGGILVHEGGASNGHDEYHRARGDESLRP